MYLEKESSDRWKVSYSIGGTLYCVYGKSISALIISAMEHFYNECKRRKLM